MEISLLGPPLIIIDSGEVLFSRRKALALLAYLVLHRGKCSRDELSYLLFPEKERSRARSDLRLILTSLRKSLGAPCLQSDNHSISLIRTEELTIDVESFNELLELRTNRKEELEEAVSLYRGRFLEGFFLDSNGQYENWQLSVEEELQWKYRSALQELVDIFIAEEQYDRAVEASMKLCRLDPLDETLHRKLMELYGLVGNTGKVKDQYEKCRKILMEEMGESPCAETDNLLSLLKDSRSRFKDKTNLPGRLDDLIGRTKELDHVLSLLTEERNSLLTLVGTGGTGKTLLSLHAGEILIDKFYHGVFFVDLSAIFSREQMIVTILQTLNISDKRVASLSSLESLISYLKSREMLLILDNFEQLHKEKETIGEILLRTENLKILITSRIPLKLDKEILLRLPPLSCPSGEERCLSPAEAEEFESVAFFVKRAALVNQNFILKRDNCHYVCHICQRLDGLPLAIELAVSHLSVLTCRELSERIDSHFPDRRKTMWKAIEWSYSLLDEEEKQLFESLSIFRGSFSPEALDALMGHSVLDSLSSLIDKSMVLRSEKQNRSRFYLLETLREFGEAKLRERGTYEEVRRRFARYFLSLASQVEPLLYSSQQMEWINRLKDDDRNLNSALEWALQYALPADGVLMIIELLRYWYYRSAYRRWRDILKGKLEKEEKSLDPGLRGRAYCSLGWMTFISGSWYESSLFFRKGLICSVEADDLKTQCLILGRLGVAERWMGDRESGLDTGKEALYIASRIGDPYYKADALIFLYCTRGGRYDDDNALEYLEEALSLSVSSGDIWSVTQCLTGLGDYYRERREHSIAVEYYNQALRKFKKNGDLWAQSWTMGDLGLTLCRMNRFREGVNFLVDAVFQLDRIGDRGGVMILLNRLGAVSLEKGNGEDATCLLSSAYQYYEGLMNSEKQLYTIDEDLNRKMKQCREKFPSRWIDGELMDQRELMSYLGRLKSL